METVTMISAGLALLLCANFPFSFSGSTARKLTDRDLDYGEDTLRTVTTMTPSPARYTRHRLGPVFTTRVSSAWQFEEVVRCAVGQQLCGNTTCFSPQQSTCLIGGIVCPKGNRASLGATLNERQNERTNERSTSPRRARPSSMYGVQSFAVDLYKQMKRQRTPHTNLVISPFSAEAALTLAWNCAGDNSTTKTELSHVLGGASASVIEFSRKVSLVTAGNSQAMYTLQTANGLFFDESYDLDYARRSGLAQEFVAHIDSLDFHGSAEMSRRKINSFVATQTNQKIRELFRAGSISQETRLVLVNALYFKADWEKPFDGQATKPHPFTLLSGQTKPVPLMYTEASVSYGVILELRNAQVVELPYKDEAVNMYVVLPAQQSSLSEVEDSLTADSLNMALVRMKKQDVHVFLPKFKVSGGSDLVQALKAMGINNAFSSRADFSKISSKQGLQITQVFQQVVLEVDEMGSEGAAATGVQLSLPSARPDPTPVFKATRPFLYFIRHNQTPTVSCPSANSPCFLANVIHETSGLKYLEELEGPKHCANGKYREVWGARPERYHMHKCYHGRGPIQLIHPQNYHDASLTIFGNAATLIDHPEWVLTDKQTNWDTAAWY
ncbi:putative Serpin B6 [Hypsibius exemplaris]|uniref:Serpin B6 n=1 Tax=Hypsibius exemplaris TaxID=2072580 RepID=A0A9X6RMW3_HYPEX|nr:putative Serpin B6 [Hypsibius exemplaris]